MFSNLKKALAAGALMLAAVVSIPTSAAAQRATFTVFNRSSYRINHMYVSSTSNNYRGSDRLGFDILYPNYRSDLALNPGWYDAKLVDQDGDSCAIRNVNVSYGETWTITDGTLLACELFSH
jgi:hypothetical protein